MPEGHLSVVSYLAVPVVSSSGKVIGGLFFGHDEPDRFGPEIEPLMTAIASQAAVAIDNARLHDAVRSELAQRREAQEAKDLLLHEIKHRVKNTLATIQALASQTLKGSPKEERAAFIQRLHSLSDAHDLLTQSDWKTVDVAALARQSLRPFAGDGMARISIEGPNAGLSANKALILTMILHELGTNAVKYGSLSNDQGRADLRWETDETADGQTLRLYWRESGGPLVAEPDRRGFGSRMILSALHGNQGSADFQYRPSGLEAALELRL
jgi:two-component sensor histidine kinase